MGGGMDVDDLCVQFGGDCSLTFSPIGRVSSDVSDVAGSSEEGVLICPLSVGKPRTGAQTRHAFKASNAACCRSVHTNGAPS